MLHLQNFFTIWNIIEKGQLTCYCYYNLYTYIKAGIMKGLYVSKPTLKQLE